MIDYDYLLQLAKASIEHGFMHDAPLVVNPSQQPSDLHVNTVVFVTIKSHGMVWCRGNLKAKPLFDAVLDMAYNSAFLDSRNQPLTRALCKDATVEISHLYGVPILSRICNPAQMGERIQPDDSIRVYFEDLSATMLSSEQPKFADNAAFIVATRKKAGIPDHFAWAHIDIARVKTIKTKAVNYRDIPCLNIV